MFFGSHEHLQFLRYEVLSPQRRYVTSIATSNNSSSIYVFDPDPTNRELHFAERKRENEKALRYSCV